MTERHTISGTVEIIEGVYSPQLENQRDLFIYLPRSYRHTYRSFPILYMHDGQNLFDEATSFSQEWHVDETMEALSGEALEAIVVGVANAGEARLDEYSPFFDERHGGGRGEAYVAFLVETVMPLVESRYRVLRGPRHTGILGSSMGGLISLYAFLQRPDHFGFAGCMSPAFWFANRAIFDYVKEQQRNPGRIYLDVGTAEGAEVLRDTRDMVALLIERGYQEHEDLLYVEAGQADHSEQAWAHRLTQPLHFLLGSRPTL